MLTHSRSMAKVEIVLKLVLAPVCVVQVYFVISYFCTIADRFVSE
jgi:hypothetical protein